MPRTPHHEWTDEEKKSMKEELSRHDNLYDAVETWNGTAIHPRKVEAVRQMFLRDSIRYLDLLKRRSIEDTGRRKGTTLLPHNTGPTVLADEVVVKKTELANLQGRAEFYEKCYKSDVPDWAKKPKSRSVFGMPIALWSDWHVPKWVLRSETNGINEYNPGVFERRAKALVEKCCMLPLEFLPHPKFDGIILLLNGDLHNGKLRPSDAARSWSDMYPGVFEVVRAIRAGINAFKKRYKKVHVKCAVGNHGRHTDRWQHGGQVKETLDWLIYQILAELFAGDPDVTFDIAESTEIMFEVYGKQYLMHHGHLDRGGEGVTGEYYPILRGLDKRSKRQNAIGKSFDVEVVGHWHRIGFLQNLIKNGSLIGLDPHAFEKAMFPEEPAQALWVDTREIGTAFPFPIYPDRG